MLKMRKCSYMNEDTQGFGVHIYSCSFVFTIINIRIWVSQLRALSYQVPSFIFIWTFLLTIFLLCFSTFCARWKKRVCILDKEKQKVKISSNPCLTVMQTKKLEE